MKRYISIMMLLVTSLTYIVSCKKSSFEEYYRDPSKVTEVNVQRLFSGMIYSYRQLTVPDYRNLFVTLRPTIFRYLHVTGWLNEQNQLLPGGAAIEDRWSRYYEGLAQYRELQTTYNKLIDVEKDENRIFLLVAKILFYDQTQQTVDLHGDIPWSKAGMLSTNKSDYLNSYPAYDKAEDIYTAMLDDLKLISTELNSIALSNIIQEKLKIQDLINSGDLIKWEKYCNSLRLRMLTRISANPNFTARASQEIAEIVGNPALYPLILTNSDNAQIDIFNLADNNINTKGIKDAFEAEGWYANMGSKLMIDHMVSNADPRLPFLFEPGKDGQYRGLDQTLPRSTQLELAKDSTISILNRSTVSKNQYFPGVLFSASETNLLLSEYYLKIGNSGLAKTHFENSVKESIDLYVAIRGVSNDNLIPSAPAPSAIQANTYLANLNWDAATNKIQLIATQKWLHFNFIQSVQAWSEQRRLDYPIFTHVVQNSDTQKVVPVKFNLPPSEPIYNKANYEAVKDQDNINIKLFWDVN